MNQINTGCGLAHAAPRLAQDASQDGQDRIVPAAEVQPHNPLAGAEIVAAFDADDAGRQLVEVIREAVASIARRTGRSDLIFKAHLPTQEGEDWNTVLQKVGLV